VINSSHRPLPAQRKQTQQTNIHVISGFRTRNPSNQAAANTRLRPHSAGIGLEIINFQLNDGSCLNFVSKLLKVTAQITRTLLLVIACGERRQFDLLVRTLTDA
jgi:hypothetical protein